jgi:hypothetical protein
MICFTTIRPISFVRQERSPTLHDSFDQYAALDCSFDQHLFLNRLFGHQQRLHGSCVHRFTSSRPCVIYSTRMQTACPSRHLAAVWPVFEIDQHSSLYMVSSIEQQSSLFQLLDGHAAIPFYLARLTILDR